MSVYELARKELLVAEQELVAQIKRVAELRRALPVGRALPEYTFLESDGASTTLADVVGDRQLVVYHMMFAPEWDEGCPSCSMWIDGLDGVAHHLAQTLNFVVIAKAPPAKLAAWAERRRWHRVRMLSSFSTSFNADLGVEDGDGNQWPAVSSFVKRDGVVHLHYSTAMVDNSMDLLCPVWHVEDLLPQGRGDWEPANDYC